MTVPISPFKESSVTILSDTVSNNLKAGALVPKGSMLLGVRAMVCIVDFKLKLKVIHQFFVIRSTIFKLGGRPFGQTSDRRNKFSKKNKLRIS
jgi:hypothetical protein